MKTFSDYMRIQNEIIKASKNNDKIDRLIDFIFQKSKNQHLDILTAGNGGSSSTAEHFAADLSLTYKRTSRPINAVCLSSQSSLLTALSNDLHYSSSLDYQINNWKDRNVLLIVFSASGMSKNILNLVQKALEFRIPTFCFVGFDGGLLARIPNLEPILFKDDKKNYGHVENIHLISCHYIIEKLNERILLP